MINIPQGDLNFRKFPQNGVFPILFFMFFWGVSFSPIAAQNLEIRNFENQTTQFSNADSGKIPSNGLKHFVEQIEEKEEEKQEDTLLGYSLDAIGSEYFNDRFVYSLILKALKGPNDRINIRVPLYKLSKP